MSDALYHGRRFRTLNVLDEGLREVLEIVIDTSLPSGRVVRTLEQLRAWRGTPQAIRCDNGPELCAAPFVSWCEVNQVAIRYIQPGKPNQNAFIERFNRTYREEVLNLYLFQTLDDVQRVTERWMQTYKEERPHDAHRRWQTLHCAVPQLHHATLMEFFLLRANPSLSWFDGKRYWSCFKDRSPHRQNPTRTQGFVTSVHPVIGTTNCRYNKHIRLCHNHT